MCVRVLTATVLATTASHAQGQQLDTALLTTLAADPQIAGADARVQAAAAAVDLGRAARLPTVALEAHASLQTSNNVYDAGRGRLYGAGVTFDLPLYTGGELTWRLRSARAALAAERADRDMLVNTRLADTAAGYAGLYRDRIVVAARTGQVADVEAILTATRARARVNELTAIDVQQGVARLALSKARLAQARAALVGSEEDLRAITGRYFTAVEDAAPPPLPAGLVDDLDGAVAAAPAVRLAEAQVEVARADVRIAQSARLPRLSLASSLQGARDPVAMASLAAPTYQTAMQIGLTFRLPLFQGGGPAARVRQAQQVLAARMEDRRATANQLTAEIRSQFAQLRAADASLAEYAVAVAAGKAALDSVKVQALLGDRTNLDILNAREEVTQAEVQLADARQRRLALAYSIQGLMGRLRPPLAAAAVVARPPVQVAQVVPRAPAYTTDKAGLWVWKGSASWSLTPGGSVPARA